MTTPSTRKMRRSREAATSSDDLLSGFDLYDVQGDARAALDSLMSSHHNDNALDGAPTYPSAVVYNTTILRLISDNNFTSLYSTEDDMVQKLEQAEGIVLGLHDVPQLPHLINSLKRRRNSYIIAYNRALILHSSGKNMLAAQICAEKLKDVMASNQKPVDGMGMVSSRLAFLFLECVLALAVEKSRGLPTRQFGISSTDAVLEWLDGLDSERDPQLKFLLTLYKSRVALAEVGDGGKVMESKVRSARKELKVAMEVFQHKLRPSFGADTASVVSSANSEDNGGMASIFPQDQPIQPSGSVVLQKLNQAALNVKANLEQLKGNTKKSLVLCSEALVSAQEDVGYNAVHSNNLAVVCETNSKRQLALHALSKAIRSNSRNPSPMRNFYNDGTARPDQALPILYNASVCALQVRNYVSAYECMATCLARSEILQSRPLCWLRLAQACLGIFSTLNAKHASPRFGALDINGELSGVLLESSLSCDSFVSDDEELALSLGSQYDVSQVKRRPLLRARYALETALSLQPEIDPKTLMYIRLNIAYVYLSFKDYKRALEMSILVLESAELVKPIDEISQTLQKRQLAAARLYAAEARCALGESVEAMKVLVGDGKGDAIDRLASDLGGVTLATAASNGKGKRRLAKAQAIVRAAACGVTATMGNPQAAKQLANSAIAMDPANRERSSARQALLYTLLREDHQTHAITLLLSLV